MDEFSKYHSTLPNEDLVRIAYFELRKIKKEARRSAKEILRKRNISEDDLKEVKEQVRTIKRHERNMKLRNKDEKYGIFDFVFDLILYE